MENLSTAMMAGQRAVDLATERYDRGLTDFLNVVDAERQFYDLQEQYAEAQVDPRRAVRAALQKPWGRVAELSSRSGHSPTSTGHHRRVSASAEQFCPVMRFESGRRCAASRRTALCPQ